MGPSIDDLDRKHTRLSDTVYTLRNDVTLAGGGLIAIVFVISFSLFSLWVTERVTHSCVDKGHNYKARYERTPATKEMVETISAVKALQDGYPPTTAQAILAAGTQKYVCDVCTYCGDVIKPEVTK